ncbi:hypothetical protein EC973_003908 [Apophysomyces ossiformis]|uniref:Uncharacterized protein n=1 Tax=Apophysomyces ossiformis TaxID=679940 RepID=A0A8H7BHG1_9FUNG|nr:hypothetical protein EC973_003908 [Apophysomyces ossiformis]
MDVRHHEVIAHYLLTAIEKGERPTLHGFVQEQRKFIAENTQIDEKLSDVWSMRFGKVAQELDITIPKTRIKPDWASVALEMLSCLASESAKSSTPPAPIMTASTKSIISVVSPSRSSSRSTPSSSRSSSRSVIDPMGFVLQASKTDSILLTETAKESFRLKYNALDQDKKWKLPSGAVVEDIMFNFGMKCEYEHPVHSFVLCLDDPCWSKEFEECDLKAIFEEGDPCLPSIHSGARNFLNAFNIPGDKASEEAVIHELWTTATSFGFFDPWECFDEDWLQSTILHLLSYYRWGFIDKLHDQGSEMDLVVYLWSLLDRCFHQLPVVTRRDQLCLATSARANENRAITDLVLFKDGVEFGLAECGKQEEAAIGKKEIVESQLLCPKTMKDMFVRAAAKGNNDESTIRGLRIVGLHQTAFRFHMTVMDCPRGYVCRILASKEYEIPIQANLIPSKLLPILELTLQAKSIVKSSIELLEKQQKMKEEMPQDFAYKSTTGLVIPQALNVFYKEKQMNLTSDNSFAVIPSLLSFSLCSVLPNHNLLVGPFMLKIFLFMSWNEDTRVSAFMHPNTLTA